jgi:putative transposase
VTEHAFDVVFCVKLVVQVKLLPTPVQAAALAATLRACNAAAEFASRVAFERNVKSRNELQKLCYREIKDRFGLSAQPAVRVVKKVVDAYAALHGGIRAGNLGGEKSRRRVKAEPKQIAFRAAAGVGSAVP